MSAISDFFNKVLGKQDETLSAVGSIAKDFEALKAAASEKDAKILELTGRVDELTASLALESGKVQTLEAAALKHADELQAAKESADKQASAKAAAITQSLGQPPVESAPNPLPAASEKKDFSHLKGLDRVAADIRRQLANTK
jgi:chromosome segregation ATPase